MDRLFVPLTTGHYNNFRSREKKYEIRILGRNFTQKFVYANRYVEIRKGYSGERLFGTIGNVLVGTLDDIFTEILFTDILPNAHSREEAIANVENILGKKDKYIAFEVKLI